MRGKRIDLHPFYFRKLGDHKGLLSLQLISDPVDVQVTDICFLMDWVLNKEVRSEEHY
jgi:hypothetical protein